MPELKNTFTGGKMEKDRDERIVGSGLYREALNIEVSTSEDSEVGAAQNILGNIQVTSAIAGPPKDYSACTFSTSTKGRYDGTNSHIAHVVDPQNDKLYRFVATDGGSHGVWMDRVVEYNTNSKIEDPWQLKERAVMVDIYKVATKINSVEAGPPIPPTPLFYGCYNGACTECSSNPTACNAPGQVIYSEATCSGGCTAAVIPGCTDPLYVEFNPAATVDDGSCSTLVNPIVSTGCIDQTTGNLGTDSTAYNFYANNNALYDYHDGSCVDGIEGHANYSVEIMSLPANYAGTKFVGQVVNTQLAIPNPSTNGQAGRMGSGTVIGCEGSDGALATPPINNWLFTFLTGTLYTQQWGATDTCFNAPNGTYTQMGTVFVPNTWAGSLNADGHGTNGCAKYSSAVKCTPAHIANAVEFEWSQLGHPNNVELGVMVKLVGVGMPSRGHRWLGVPA